MLFGYNLKYLFGVELAMFILMIPRAEHRGTLMSFFM